MPKRQFLDAHILQYQRSMRCVLVTTRFNHITWNENQSYRHHHLDPSYTCIYASPSPMAQCIPRDMPVVVLEMHNEENRIMGIGVVRNHPIINRHPVYTTHPDFNTFAYLGKHRVDRDDFTPEEETVMRVLDHLCFKGKRHLKRLKGLKQFPLDMLYQCKTLAQFDVLEFLVNMIRKRATASPGS